MLKKFVLLAWIIFYTGPLLAHNGCPAPHHNHESFFCEGGRLPDNETSYVLLPDGSHYVLDSKFWQATKNLAVLLVDDDHGHGALARVLKTIKNVRQKHFWVRLSASGIRLFRRYGPPAVVIIGGGEFLEHALVFCPLPLGCATIYTGGVFSSKHMLRFWNLVRSRYPLDAGLFTRVKLGLQQWKWNWQYWRAMRKIYRVPNGNRRFLRETSPDSRMAAYFLAQEKTAYLEIQLQLADQKIAPLAETHVFIFQTLNWHLTTLGKAMDAYSAVLAGRAMTGQPIEDDPSLNKLDDRFENFFKSVDEFVDIVNKGSLPLTSNSGQVIWDTARELKKDIRNLQVMGCAQWLKTGV